MLIFKFFLSFLRPLALSDVHEEKWLSTSSTDNHTLGVSYSGHPRRINIQILYHLDLIKTIYLIRPYGFFLFGFFPLWMEVV